MTQGTEVGNLYREGTVPFLGNVARFYLVAPSVLGLGRPTSVTPLTNRFPKSLSTVKNEGGRRKRMEKDVSQPVSNGNNVKNDGAFEAGGARWGS